jgi:indolepyruvate ferredoxin oxidoreductase alpha subunit
MAERLLLPEGKLILLGNEAIVRGALESGVAFAAGFPGTPASEIGDTFCQVAKQAGIYSEYSTNEKAAVEAVAAAALSKVKSIASFKHYGLNVAIDSIIPLGYIGVNAGMVIAVADDPEGWSSIQGEHDSRHYARLASLPMLDPSDAQECKDFVKFAFDLSEKCQLPVFVRTTTRVSHSRSIVKLGKIIPPKTKGEFVKDIKRYNLVVPILREAHLKLLEKIEEIKKLAEKSNLNTVLNKNVKSKVGIITSGVSFSYVQEALKELKIKLPVLKLGFSYPLPEMPIKNFIKNLKSVLVVEELDPVLENEIKALAKDVNPKLVIHGKDYLPAVGEFKPHNVLSAVSKLSGKKSFDFEAHLKKYSQLDIPKRFPVLCPGCPHASVFYAVKDVAPDAVYCGDIGCYLIGVLPPYNIEDFIISMGASIGTAHGIKKVTDQKVIAFIGDGTFFHAGIPQLINISYNKSNPVIIVLDNRITAMTGHQQNPGSGLTGMQDQAKEIKVEDIATACGIENVKVVDSYNVNGLKETLKEALSKDTPTVLVAKRECQLLAVRKKKAQGIKIPKFEIDQSKCNKCGVCLYNFHCPAIYKDNDKFLIDKELCTGCTVCSQVCPVKAIKVMQ